MLELVEPEILGIALVATTIAAFIVYWVLKNKFVRDLEEPIFYTNFTTIVTVLVPGMLFDIDLQIQDAIATSNTIDQHSLLSAGSLIVSSSLYAIIASLVISLLTRFLLTKKFGKGPAALSVSYWFLFLAFAFEIITFSVLSVYPA